MLSVNETAKRLGISTSSLYELARQRKISHCRIGVGRGRLLFTEADIEDFLESCRVKAGAKSPATKFTHART